MQCWPSDPRRQMTLIGGDRRPLPSSVEDFGKCRGRMTIGEMTDDAKRHLVQLEKDEASTFGHALTSAFGGLRSEDSRHYGYTSRTPPRAYRATTTAISGPPLQFG